MNTCQPNFPVSSFNDDSNNNNNNNNNNNKNNYNNNNSYSNNNNYKNNNKLKVKKAQLKKVNINHSIRILNPCSVKSNLKNGYFSGYLINWN